LVGRAPTGTLDPSLNEIVPAEPEKTHQVRVGEREGS
jgi:hypothetical protein